MFCPLVGSKNSSSSLAPQTPHSALEKTKEATRESWRHLAAGFALLGVLTSLSLTVYMGSAIALAALALTAVFFTYVFFIENGRSSKSSPLRVIDGIYKELQKTFSFSSSRPSRASSFEEISLLPPIKQIVISGGGAKGAVLPGAFRALLKDSPDLIENTEHLFGSSVGALFAALVATGISREGLKIIQQSNLNELLGEKPIYKDGKELMHFLRQWMRVNILSQLLQLPEERKRAFHEKEPFLADEMMKQLLEAPLEEACISFRMLAYLHIIYPSAFKDLSVTATKKEGGQFIFDAQRTPDTDVALACRASASLPIVFDPVQMVYQGETLTLFDGGLIDNIPVALVEEKKGKPAERVSDKTLVFVFEKQSDFPSVFHPENPNAPYRANFQTRLLRDEVIPRVAGFTLPTSYTVLRSELLNKIKNQYRHVISFRVDLKTRDFHKASKHPKKYSRIGKEAVRNFLAQRAAVRNL